LVQAGLTPTLFDKGREPGGRVATRNAEGQQFDHGAQYVNAHGDRFTAVLRDLVASGDAALWQDGTGRSHTVGTPGMSALPKALAAGLDLRQNAHVTRITRTRDGWLLRIGEIEQKATHVVITVPAPQVAALLGADHPLLTPLATVRFAPCLTLMAAVKAPALFVSLNDHEDPLSCIAQDTSKPGRPSGDFVAWVAQAGATFSVQHLEKDPGEIVALMLPMLCDRLAVQIDTVRHASVHRWRYARVTTPLGQPFLRAPDAALYLAGDWCIGPRVEAAWISGTSAAEDLLAQIT
jgi:predicted NAD/FAD-dependent oxidoreductase